MCLLFHLFQPDTLIFYSLSLVSNAHITLADFWTTKCTNCPEALDNLNTLATDERYKNIKFASICCGADHKCTDVRNILEKEDNPRWDRISHYFMDFDGKEEAKKALGFKQVPFYVVLNDEGEIVMMGSKKYIDFDNLPGMVHPTPIKVEKKAESVPSPTNVAAAEEAFAILDLDF